MNAKHKVRVATREVATHRNAAWNLDFEEANTPWIDRPDADVAGYVGSLSKLPQRYDLAQKLTDFREKGYAVFEGLIGPGLIDTYLADLETVFRHPQRYPVRVNCDGRRELVTLDTLSPQDLDGSIHYRIWRTTCNRSQRDCSGGGQCFGC